MKKENHYYVYFGGLSLNMDGKKQMKMEMEFIFARDQVETEFAGRRLPNFFP